jgi:ABC-type nitrate/sulfonate/bicarbonate transport system substrate-binding protein
LLFFFFFIFAAAAESQDKKLERIRVGGGSASATQMSMWLAKEGGFYEKHGLSVEAISIPGSSLALQAMLAGELPIIQLGGAASIQSKPCRSRHGDYRDDLQEVSPSGFTRDPRSHGWKI